MVNKLIEYLAPSTHICCHCRNFYIYIESNEDDYGLIRWIESTESARLGQSLIMLIAEQSKPFLKSWKTNICKLLIVIGKLPSSSSSTQ